MNAKKCDRCGAFYMPAETATEYVEKIVLAAKGMNHKKITDICDLCPKCVKEFYNWMQSGGTEKMLTIVSVRFNETATKTYDYVYMGDEAIQIGDTVTVKTEHQGAIKVEVVNVFQIAESQAEYDYKPAI